MNTQIMKSKCSGIEYYYLPNGQLYVNGVGAYKTNENMPNDVNQWRKLVYDKAKKYNIAPALIVAVMWQESRGNASAGSYANAFGLMQLILSTAKMMAGRSVSKEELFDPDLNVDLGAKLLAKLNKDYNGNLPHILAAYNAGGAFCGTGKKYPSGEPCAPNRYGLVQNCGYIDAVIRNYNKSIELGWDGHPVSPTSKFVKGLAIFGFSLAVAGIGYGGAMLAREKGYLG